MNFTARLEDVVGRLLRDEVIVAQVSGGLTFWLLRDRSAKEGFHMDPPPLGWEELSEEALGFVATQTPPPEYPTDLPFLGNSAAIVMAVDEGSPTHTLPGRVLSRSGTRPIS